MNLRKENKHVFPQIISQTIFIPNSNKKIINSTLDTINALPANTNSPAIASGIMAAIFIAPPIIIMLIIFFIFPRPGIIFGWSVSFESKLFTSHSTQLLDTDNVRCFDMKHYIIIASYRVYILKTAICRTKKKFLSCYLTLSRKLILG